jgi:Calcineurin-like phosphoesterase
MLTKTFNRFVNLLIVLSLALNANAVVHAATRSAPALAPTITFNATADAYVIATYPSVNYGTATQLRVDSSPITRSFLRFVVSGLAGGTVQSAVLRIYANSANSTGFAAHSITDNTWTESGITYANSPAIGSVINNSLPFSGGAWVEVNITSYVTADGTYDLAIDSTNSTNTNLASREVAANPPQLVVTLAGAGGATSTPIPTSTAIATSTPTTAPGSTATPGQSSVFTFKASADAYVIATYPSVNYGLSTPLRVDGSPITRSYLRFVVSGLAGGTVQSAVLRIYANSANTTGFAVHSVADNNWTESGITYANSPALGSVINSSLPFSGGAWVEVNITSVVTADGTYNLAIDTTNSTNTSLASREVTANAPQLVVTAGGQGGATSTPIPTSTTIATRTPTTQPTSTSTPLVTSTPGFTATSTTVPVCSAVTLTKGPTLIFTGDITRMRISWQWSTTATFQMEWGTNTSYGLGDIAVNPTDTTNHLYQYDISGLTPGTKYYYQVVVGSQCSGGTFYAAPASNATSVKFTAYGDTRTNGSVHNGLAGQVVSLFRSDPAFQTLNLNVGDWVSADSESAWTSEWFATAYSSLRTQDANLSDIGVRGNHEGAATYWKRYWPEPFQPGGLYWSFDYGPMHVVMLDAYTAYTTGSAQYNWLKADLAASTKTWKIVMIHEPGWSANGGHANNTTVQTAIQPLLVQYGVAMLLAGHNHYYARANVNGVVHLTVGGGGAPLYTPATGQPNIVTATKAYSFGEFTISGNTLTAKIVNNSGATIDTFTITK